METLSKREREVYLLIVRGLMNKQIAIDLGISDKTVSTYKRRIKEKLGLETDRAIISHYYKRGKLELSGVRGIKYETLYF
jgi:DNA-binding CsgD family transcriptional regulator